MNLQVKSRLESSRQSASSMTQSRRNQSNSRSSKNLASISVTLRPKNRSMSKTKKRDSSRSNSKSNRLPQKRQDLSENSLKVPKIEKYAENSDLETNRHSARSTQISVSSLFVKDVDHSEQIEEKKDEKVDMSDLDRRVYKVC